MTRYFIEIFNIDLKETKQIMIFSQNEHDLQYELSIYLDKIGWKKEHIRTNIKT